MAPRSVANRAAPSLTTPLIDVHTACVLAAYWPAAALDGVAAGVGAGGPAAGGVTGLLQPARAHSAATASRRRMSTNSSRRGRPWECPQGRAANLASLRRRPPGRPPPTAPATPPASVPERLLVVGRLVRAVGVHRVKRLHRITVHPDQLGVDHQIRLGEVLGHALVRLLVQYYRR